MEKNDLFDMDSVDLYECINCMKFELQSRNFEYKKLKNKVENIKERFPKIRDILEDEEPSELTIEESSMLIKIDYLIFVKSFFINLLYYFFVWQTSENDIFLKKLYLFHFFYDKIQLWLFF